MQKQILSLCDYSGNWSAPYRANGYHVTQIDLATGADVRLMEYPGPIHGILAAPPCTAFCRPGARLWKQWGNTKLLDGLSIIDACLRLVAICKPIWWCLENPPGRLRNYLGPHTASFQPWHYGDNHTKLTYLWGSFNMPPVTHDIQPDWPQHLPPGQRDFTSRKSSSHRQQRANTPVGFAQAFYLANP